MKFEYRCPEHGTVSGLRDRRNCPDRSSTRRRCGMTLQVVAMELSSSSA